MKLVLLLQTGINALGCKHLSDVALLPPCRAKCTNYEKATQSVFVGRVSNSKEEKKNTDQKNKSYRAVYKGKFLQLLKCVRRKESLESPLTRSYG